MKHTKENRAEFFKAYTEALVWSSGEEFDNHNGFAPDFRAKAVEDCFDFLEKAGDMVHELGYAQAGYDFALTRNGHGAGFWDGDWAINGDTLTKIANDMGEIYLWLEDGTVLLDVQW